MKPMFWSRGVGITSRWLVLVTLALLLAGSATARAENVTITLVNPLPSLSFQYKLGGSDGSASAGGLHWHNPGGSGGLPTDFVTFCDELTQHIGLGGTYTYVKAQVQDTPFPGPGSPTPGFGMGDAKANLVRELWGTFRNLAVDPTTEAAFQIAIWEIVNDTGLDLGAGNFQARYSGPLPAQVTQAQTWLSSLGKGLPGHSLSNELFALSSGDVQDQLFSTPVPPGIVLLGLGGCGLLLGFRRRKLALQI